MYLRILLILAILCPFVPLAAAIQESTIEHAINGEVHGDDPSRGPACHKLTAQRSWNAMKSFFQELFSQP